MTSRVHGKVLTQRKPAEAEPVIGSTVGVSSPKPRNPANVGQWCAMEFTQGCAVSHGTPWSTLPAVHAFDAQAVSNAARSHCRTRVSGVLAFGTVFAACQHSAGDVNEQEAYSLLWALWRSGDPNPLFAIHRHGMLDAEFDSLVCGLLSLTDEWRMDALGEAFVDGWISRTLPIATMRKADGSMGALTMEDDARNPFHHRLSRLLEITCAVSGAEETLSAIEAYGQVSSWLKVAGEAKAEVLADTIQRRLPSTTEGTLELGAFVGYSAIQFAKKIARAHMTGTSLEIDPVHVAVSRFHVDRARFSTTAEIWAGQLQDSMPRVTEMLGAHCLSFVFMDQRGTTFHDDLSHVESLRALAPSSHIAADNTLKPGSPVYVWHVTVGAEGFVTAAWSMSEFALELIEDWQTVSLLCEVAVATAQHLDTVRVDK